MAVRNKREADRLRSPFIMQNPYSQAADKIGISDGDLIAKYASDAIKLIKIRDDLQTIVDSFIHERVPGTTIQITHFINWGETQESLLLHVKPTEPEQVVAIVKGVLKLKKDKNTQVKIGMGGSYHTWSSTYPDQMGLLVNTCNLKLTLKKTSDGYRRINLNVNADPEKTTVTISPGVTTGELMAFFLANNICFESDAILSTMTYGGLFTGGCHGVGSDQTTMSDWIVSMTIVDGFGNVRSLSELHTSDDIMKAARTNLGLFGVILEFTVKVKPMSNAKVNNLFSMKLKDIVPRKSLSDIIWGREHTEELGKLLTKYGSVEIFWFPFNSIVSRILGWLPMGDNVTNGSATSSKRSQSAQLRVRRDSLFSSESTEPEEGLTKAFRARNLLPLFWSPYDDHLWVRGIDRDKDRKLEITQEPGLPFWSKVIDVAQQTGGEYILSPLMKNVPGVTPISLLIGFQLVKLQYGTLQEEEVVRTPWAIHFRDGIDIMRVYDLEFAFPIDIDHPLKAVQAIRKVIDIVKDYAFNGKFPEDEESISEEEKGSEIYFPLTMCMEMRVIHKSKALLCPASLGNEDHIAYIEVLSTSGTRGYEDFFEEVAMAWVELGGVPHWQKQWEFLKNADNFDVFTYLRQKYGSNMTNFMKVYRDLKVDPEGIFMNDTMKKLLVDQ